MILTKRIVIANCTEVLNTKVTTDAMKAWELLKKMFRGSNYSMRQIVTLAIMSFYDAAVKNGWGKETDLEAEYRKGAGK